jgi:hypothetical protein
VRREDVVADTLEESAEVMLNAILLRVVLFLCARGADENSRGIEVTRRERHEKVPLLVVDDSLPPLSKKNKITRIEHVSRPRFFFILSLVLFDKNYKCVRFLSSFVVYYLNETFPPPFSLFFFFFSLSLPQKKEADDFIPNDGGVVTAYRREEKQLLFRRGTQK